MRAALEAVRGFFKKYPHAWWSLYVPFYIAAFFAIESVVTPDGAYWETSLWLDGRIPFLEVFVVPYCLWFPMLAAVGIWLLVRDGPAFRRFLWSIMFMFTLSLVIYLVFPTGQDLRPEVMPLSLIHI